MLHCLTGGNFTTEVNGHTTGHKEEWGAFDREEIRSQLRFGAGIAGDNEILVHTIARDAQAPNTTANAFAAVLDLRDHQGRERHIVSDATWTSRSGVEAPWTAAQVVGPLHNLRVNVGSDRHEMEGAPDRISTGVSLLRRSFAVQGTVRAARLYVTAMGSYRAFVNGKRVGEDGLTPGFTDFRKRVLYQTYDVTSLLKGGKNALGVMLGGGWHSSPLLWAGVREFPGADMLRAQLVLTMSDGSEQVIQTDRSWQATQSATDSAEIYGGESYDARREQEGWNTASFKPSAKWTAVQEGSVQAQIAISAAGYAHAHLSDDQAGVPEGRSDRRRCARSEALRHGTEHGRRGSVACAWSTGYGGAPALCRTAESRWQRVHGKPAQR